MSIRVYGWDQNPSVDRHICRLSNARGKARVEENKARFVTDGDGRRAIQLEPPTEILMERGARNSLMPFGRVLNKLKRPPVLHYPVPAVGDHRIAWLNSFMTPEAKPTPDALVAC